VAVVYTVGISDHFLVAHSLRGEVFGPAQRLHGATYTVHVEVEREELLRSGIVVEIGLLREELRRILHELDYSNLDDHPAFEGGSTAELIARYLHRELSRLPAVAGTTVSVTLHESPVAWARYRGAVRGPSLLPPGEIDEPQVP
jgi:6-pyruvoyltetrahydropterin/6-carboxytetrahydropterin synthase